VDNTKQWVMALAGFLIALFIGNLVTVWVSSQIPGLAGGMIGFIVGGSILFAVWITVQRIWKGVEPPT